MIKITALGTNGWFDSATGNTNCTLIQTDDYSIVLDAGFGIAKMKERVDFSKPVYIFLTHLHLDHTVGLHVLGYFDFKQPLRIIAPLGGSADLKALLREPFTTPWESFPFPVEIIDAADLASAGLPFGVEALPLVHAVPDTGFRFEVDGKVIAFVLDTEYCENAVKLAKDADFLITEAGFLPGMYFEGVGHMNPETAAKLTRVSGAKHTLLLHFGGNAYASIEDRSRAVAAGRAVAPNLILGLDGAEFVL